MSGAPTPSRRYIAGGEVQNFENNPMQSRTGPRPAVFKHLRAGLHWSASRLAASCRAADVEIWAWCLMPNHVHLILVPSDADGLRRALAPVHRRYAGIIHARRKRTGHFWQGRFGCVAMDEEHLAAALRYVSLNPVRARLVDARTTGAGPACAHISRPGRRGHGARAGSRALPRFREFAVRGPDAETLARLRGAETVGRPLGNRKFLDMLERKTKRVLKPAKRGPSRVSRRVKCTVTVMPRGQES